MPFLTPEPALALPAATSTSSVLHTVVVVAAVAGAGIRSGSLEVSQADCNPEYMLWTFLDNLWTTTTSNMHILLWRRHLFANACLPIVLPQH